MRFITDLLHLILPQYCAGCKRLLALNEKVLCLYCLASLPATDYHLIQGNPVAEKFLGRVPLSAATSCFYFQKKSVMQHIIHQFKYHNQRAVALYMGKMMGYILEESPYFKSVEGVVPVPLHAKRKKKRGYNQSELLAKGLSEVLQVPVFNHLLIRKTNTTTQTQLNAMDRWNNVKNAFVLSQNIPKQAHLLLVDDVLTSGSTLEACATELNKIQGKTISIATLAIAED